MYCNVIYYSMSNSRFSISVHILSLLAAAGEAPLSSGYIAGSININPVLVRKELINLRNHGLIDSKEGKNGGSWLAKPANQIKLSQVYDMVQQTPIMGQTKNIPNPDCHIGKQINTHLDSLYKDVENTLRNKLSKTTLADFTKQFK